MTTSSQPAASGAGSTTSNTKKPVVSHFFAKPSASGSTSQAAASFKKPLTKKPSIIELSDSDESSQDGAGNDDDDVQVIEPVPLTSKKRKSSPSTILKQEDDDGVAQASAKKLKVAPLFNKARVAQAVLKQEKTEAGQAKDKLSKWKFSPASPPSATLPSATTSKSTPSPSLTSRAKTSGDKKLEARRAEVRRKLLGVDFNRRPPDDTPVDEDGDAPMRDEEDDDGEPVASTSKLPPPAKGKKGNNTANEEPGGSKNRFSKFAAGAASSEESETATVKGKKKATTTTSKKGKGKEEGGVKYTPLEQQVLDIKAKHPDTLLIVEVGYKFKFFGDDAKIASKELNIACFMSQNFFTAMIPVHRLQVHIKRLITQGYKVGVVRQKETAALKKAGDNRSAPFTRELTNLYTAATYVEGLDDGSVTGAPPTFGTLLCLCEESRGGKGSDEKVSFGLVSAQPSTGEVIYDSFDDGFLRSELETRLLHIQPGELVIQGEISAPTNRVISYLLKQDAASTGLAQNRMEQNEKTLSYNKALKLITDFYGAAAKEPTDSPAKKKVKNGSKKKHKRSVDSDDDTDMVDLTLLSSQEGPSRQEREEDEQEDNADAGQALAAILGLPERVVVALAGLLKHLTAFQLESVFKRPKYFTPFAERGHMLLNANTVANLEIFRNQTNFKATGSLFSVLDHTKTPFGQRLLRRWVAKPLLQLDALRTRVDAVDEILNSESYLLGKMRGLLKGLPDLERGLARIHYGKSTPQELVRVLSAFQRIADEFPNLPKDLKQTNVGFKSDMVNDVFYALPALKPVVQEFISVMDTAKAREGKKEDIFLMEFEPEEITDCKEVLLTVEAEFQQHLLECRKILKKPAAEYITVAQDEYLLEVRISESKIVPHDWLRINGTKAAYRYRSPRMQTLLDERDQANERLAAEADAAFLKFLASISAKYEAFRDVVTKLATIDCLISLSIVGLSQGYVKPELVDEPCLEIVGGRHPVVEQLMDTPFIPNDVSFAKDGLRAMVITGCNMSGKSSFSRMVALLVIMAQIGCHLPCESAKIGIVDYVGTRFGASDEIQRGRSTFMVELTETCEIIKAASPRSLIVLDELGRGTSTNDGLAIAHAVLEYVITTCKASTLFITHFPQLASLAAKYPVQCQLFQMAYMEEEGANRIPDITFLYKLISGLTDRVHGISCARMAGLPASVCELAASKSKEIEDTDQANLTNRKTQHIRSLFVALQKAQHQDSEVNVTQVIQYARDFLNS